MRPMVVLHRLLGNAVGGLACPRPGVGLLLPKEGLDIAAHHGSLSEADDAAVVTSPSYSSSRGRAPPRVAAGGSLPEAIVPHCDDARWVTGSLTAARNMLQPPGRAEETTAWPRSPPLMASAIIVPRTVLCLRPRLLRWRPRSRGRRAFYVGKNSGGGFHANLPTNHQARPKRHRSGTGATLDFTMKATPITLT